VSAAALYAGRATGTLSDIVVALRDARKAEGTATRRQELPSRDALVKVVTGLRAALFPEHFGATDLSDDGIDYFVGRTLDATLFALHEQVRRGFYFTERECGDADRRATELTRAFAKRLPDVRLLLASDVRAAFEGDPAAKSPDEALFCYPGITAITNHRLAHELYRLGVPIIARIVSEIAHAETGIDIHPGAQIGPRFFIDHGTGVVIGETCVIGERVRIYQGVTLGAKSFPLDQDGKPIKGIARHPVVQDDVVIYAGATILGRITIGAGSTIGGNVWLTHNVPPHSHVTQAHVRQDLFEGGSGI
jgi:serine O-acetyltransferase